MMAGPGPSVPSKPIQLRGPKVSPGHGRRSKGIFPTPQVGVGRVGDEKEEAGLENGEVQPDQNDGDDEKSQQPDDRSDAQSAAGQPPNSSPPSETPKKKKSKLHPQQRITKAWKNFDPEYVGKVTRVLPTSAPAVASSKPKPARSQNAAESYQQAREQCEADVRKIINECLALNQKYTDVHFDLEADLKVTRKRDCLDGLVQNGDEEDKDDPADVKRVTDLFDDPKFFSDGAGFDDIIQGSTGDCWLMSAFSVLSCSEHLIRRVCVIQDQDVGVYGFVFFRDGEWHPTIIDDKLYLSTLAFDESISNVLATWGKEQEQKYTELFQRGSKALYFARCRDDNETWVPLLEKALAKAHGGYDALRGGQTGEAIEDLTGGVTTEIYTTNILSKEKFWTNELCKLNKEFMFDASDPIYREWMGWDESSQWVSRVRKERRKGVVERHAYAVLDVYEGYGERLVKVRNPWGEQEWDGAWSDGSPQWTAAWLDRLAHKFGDDGVFWMSYKDFLHQYKHINRTRIFDDSWYTAQKWASVQVPFSNIDYQQTKFTISVPEDTETVIVLSQLDERYFCGLGGKYGYRLQFRISKSENEDEYIARSRPNYELNRSTNIELYLRKGTYTVLIKIEALDWGRPTPEDVIKANLPQRKEKVTTIGRLYDLAHQKGLREPEEDSTDTIGETEDEATQTEDESAAVPTPAAASTLEPVSAPSAVMMGPPPPDPPLADDEDSDDEDEEEKDPWNAACVVGLRVYSKLPELSVKVVWPPKPKENAISPTPAPDRDAITKAAQDEAEKNAGPQINGDNQEEPEDSEEQQEGDE